MERGERGEQGEQENGSDLGRKLAGKKRPREFDHHWLKLFAFTAPSQQFGLSGEFDG